MSETREFDCGCARLVGLVVDDEPLVRKTVAEVLREICTTVYEADDGVHGLAELEAHPEVSLLVTDVMMPRVDGLALAAIARQRRPGLRVLFLSGLQRPPAPERFVPKPFRAKALLAEVAGLVGSRRPRD